MATISPGFAAKQARLAGAKIASGNPGGAFGAGKVEAHSPGKPTFGGKPAGNAASKLAALMRLKAAMRTGAMQMGGDGQRDQLASAGGKPMGGAVPQVNESAGGF
jgi:hypothetical protein